MKNILLAVSLISSAAIASNINLGDQSLDGQRGSDDIIAIGNFAGNNIKISNSSIAVGDAALYMSSNISYSIAIGMGAMASAGDMSGNVAIGNMELAGVGNLRDTTSINRHQLFISRQLGAFAINPFQASLITDSPFYFMDGKIYLNAPVVANDLRFTLRGSGESYDIYLAPDGNDANDGLTPLRAKRTLDGCLAAATRDGMRVGVFPGDYAPPKNYDAKSNPKQFIPHTTSIEFVAIEGRGKTSISGIYEDGPSGTNGCYHTLAFAEGDHVFKGFKINNISGYYNTGGFTASNKSCPAFSCITLVDCEVTCDTLNYYHYYGAFNSCIISNSIVRFNTVREVGDVASNSSVNIFAGCEFDGTELYITAAESSLNRWRIFKNGNIKDSLIVLPPIHETEAFSYSPYATNCTIIYDAPEGATPRFSYERAVNCYYAVGTGTVGTGDNAFAPSWTNTLLNADYVPMSIDCPAVRDDGRKDAGWKDSGLGCQKSFETRANIRIENGALVVYQGGVVIGTIPMDAVATTLKAPRPTASPAPVEEEDPEDESVILLNRL